MENKIYLSIIIPAYNEEKRIADTLVDISRYLSKRDYSSEIIVVNDGSKDKTSQIVSEMKGTIHNLKFIDNIKNQGKGGVVKQGMLEATGEYRLFVDADNAISINHLDNFWQYTKEYDVVIGSIEIEGAQKKEKYEGFSKIYRNVLGKLSKYLVRALAVWEIHDTQRAFKLFKGESAEKIFSCQTIMRWGFDIEVLVIAKKFGYKIKELPVAWLNPPGRVNFMSYINTLKELLQIKWNIVRGKYK
ncbi:glycosyltransferase family 2 protein [Patescibacteria group bacterium]|nr:glycosyltransferase family 2 protein [Patescibacteria group bacterium]MBU2632926.1 glycosyltransferase family 2 protein [Patescibacteria group bacterium]